MILSTGFTDLQRYLFNDIPYVLLNFDIKNNTTISLRQIYVTEFSHEYLPKLSKWIALSLLNDAVSKPDGIKFQFIDYAVIFTSSSKSDLR